MELVEFAKRALHEGIGIYSIRLYPVSGAFHFEIQLDGLNHPMGSVSVSDCEKFSRRFSELLDAEIALTKDEILFVENLKEDNYTLEVSSAGIERELRLPEDLDRFKDLPLKVLFLDEGKKRVIHATYTGSGIENDAKVFIFKPYEPKKGRSNKAHRVKKKVHVEKDGMIKILFHDIVKINLFLDF